jgi:hypothetical protein
VGVGRRRPAADVVDHRDEGGEDHRERNAGGDDGQRRRHRRRFRNTGRRARLGRPSGRGGLAGAVSSGPMSTDMARIIAGGGTASIGSRKRTLLAGGLPRGNLPDQQSRWRSEWDWNRRRPEGLNGFRERGMPFGESSGIAMKVQVRGPFRGRGNKPLVTEICRGFPLPVVPQWYGAPSPMPLGRRSTNDGTGSARTPPIAILRERRRDSSECGRAAESPAISCAGRRRPV